MKKLAFIVIAASGLFVANAETIEAFGAPDLDAGGLALRESHPEVNSAQEALCKEVEVPLDEGYGVSQVEKRSVCRDDR